MRRFAFRDVHGRNGRITDDLNVEYRGEWEREVKSCVERIESEGPADGRTAWDVDDAIVLELPEEAPIVEVERIDRRE